MVCWNMSWCVEICHGVLKYGMVCWSMPWCVEICHGVLKYAMVCWNMPWCVEICHGVLECVMVCWNISSDWNINHRTSQIMQSQRCHYSVNTIALQLVQFLTNFTTLSKPETHILLRRNHIDYVGKTNICLYLNL